MRKTFMRCAEEHTKLYERDAAMGKSRNVMQPPRISRQDIYELFSRAGYRAPAHGLVAEIAPAVIAAAWSNSNLATGRPLQQGPYQEPQVVVYLDDYASGGEGMVLLPAQEALDKYPGNYCSEYLHGGDHQSSEAIRLLQVGCRRWLVKYRSSNGWKANSGDCEASVLYEQEARYVDEIPYPIWAVDFIQAGKYGLLAVDFTTTPALDPIRGIVTLDEVEELITNLWQTPFFRAGKDSKGLSLVSAAVPHIAE